MQMMEIQQNQATQRLLWLKARSRQALGVVPPGLAPRGAVFGPFSLPRTGPGFVPEANCPQRALQQVRGLARHYMFRVGLYMAQAWVR